MAVITAPSFKSPFIILICAHITNLASPGFASDWVQIANQVQLQNGENVTVKAVTISDDYIWGVDNRPNNRYPPGNVVLCELPCIDGNWIDGDGTFDHIDADSRHVWGTSPSITGDRLHRRLIDASEPFAPVKSFDPFECTCSCDITVSNNGHYVWVLLCVETVMFDGSNWTTIPHEMSLTQIEADNEEVWAVDTNNKVFKRPVNGSGEWSSVPGEMRYISASGNAHVWGIAPNNSLYVCEKPCTGCWQYVGGSFQQIDGGNSSVVGVTTDGSILIMSVEDVDSNFITDECPTILATTPDPVSEADPQSSSTTSLVNHRESSSDISVIVGSLASVIALILFSMLMIGGIVLAVIRVLRKRQVKQIRMKYISNEGGYLATDSEDGSRVDGGFDNRVYSNCDPDYDSVDDNKSNGVEDARPRESRSDDFRNRMDSVPNTYSLERTTSSRATSTVDKGQSAVSSATNDDNDDGYELDGNVDENYSKPGETFDDEYDYADEKEFWEPASQENELVMQVEKLTEIPVVKRDELQTHEELGSGQFGTVYRGVWQPTADSEDTGVEVAVKTMEEGASEEERVKFLQEAAIMGQFKNHPNILRILGIVLDAPYKILVELMHKGDLHHYLPTIKPDPDQPVATELGPTLLSYTKQVAHGLMYLFFKKYVHRDIAARNILVNDEGICKIADFGLSRDLFDENYYVSHGGKVPVKWTAPEAINYRKYSAASDVWSYGCLLYEIWSLGVKPFHDVSNKQALEKIDSGYRLPPPPGCPKAIYQIMIKCWHPTAASRPTPSSIVMGLSYPDFKILKWSQKDIDATSEEARTLGATLTEGHALYKGLQQTYYKYY